MCRYSWLESKSEGEAKGEGLLAIDNIDVELADHNPSFREFEFVDQSCTKENFILTFSVLQSRCQGKTPSSIRVNEERQADTPLVEITCCIFTEAAHTQQI